MESCCTLGHLPRARDENQHESPVSHERKSVFTRQIRQPDRKNYLAASADWQYADPGFCQRLMIREGLVKTGPDRHALPQPFIHRCIYSLFGIWPWETEDMRIRLDTGYRRVLVFWMKYAGRTDLFYFSREASAGFPHTLFLAENRIPGGSEIFRPRSGDNVTLKNNWRPG